MTASTFADSFGGTLDSHWVAVKASPSLVSESLAIPSNDGKVLQFGADAGQGLVVQGTEAWTTATALPDVTVSCSILPTAGTGWVMEQGVLIGAQPSFNFAGSDSYYLAELIHYNDSFKIRLNFNDPAVGLGLGGYTFIEGPAPGDPLDGQYHKLTLKLSRDGQNMMTALWDDQVALTYGHNTDWYREPAGRVGVYAVSAGAGDLFKFDNFQASWDNAPTPIPPKPALVPETIYQKAIKDTPSLIGYYTFDNDKDTSALLIDVKGAHNSVAQKGTGSPYLLNDGVQGSNCMKFDGSSWFDCGSIPAFTFVANKKGSLEFWVKIDPIKGRMGFVSANTGSDSAQSTYQWQADTGVPCLLTWDGNGAPAWTYPGATVHGSWHQVNVVYTAGQAMPAVYLDAQLQTQDKDYYNTAGFMGLGPDQNAVFVIGNTSQDEVANGDHLAMKGEMDEVSVYSEPLTAAQILAHYQAAQAKVPVTLSQFEIE